MECFRIFVLPSCRKSCNFLKLQRAPSRPSSGLQPATRRWRAFVRRSSDRPASTKQPSATAARRSPVTCARRPRSRLGSPARLRWSGGRHRFRQASSPPVQVRRFAATFPVSPQPAFIHARRTGLVQRFLHDPAASTGPASFRRRSGSRRCYSQIQTKCKEKQPPPEIPGSGRCRSTFQAVFSVERPMAVSVKKTIVVAPAALGPHPGSSIFRRQPARLRPAPVRITPRRSLLHKTAARSRHRT